MIPQSRRDLVLAEPCRQRVTYQDPSNPLRKEHVQEMALQARSGWNTHNLDCYRGQPSMSSIPKRSRPQRNKRMARVTQTEMPNRSW